MNHNIKIHIEDIGLEDVLNKSIENLKLPPLKVDINFTGSPIRSNPGSLKINSNNAIANIALYYEMMNIIKKNHCIPIIRNNTRLQEFFEGNKFQVGEFTSIFGFPITILDNITRESVKFSSIQELIYALKHKYLPEDIEDLIVQSYKEIDETFYIHANPYLSEKIINYRIGDFQRSTRSGLIMCTDALCTSVHLEGDRRYGSLIQRSLPIALDAIKTINLDYGIIKMGYTHNRDELTLLDISNKVNEFIVYPAKNQDYYSQMYAQTIVHTILSKYEETRGERFFKNNR